MTVNQRIFHYRKLAGLTQSEVADQMGLKLNTYSKMEREGRITIEKLLKIAQILGIDYELLVSDEKKEPKIEYIPVPVQPVTQPPLTLGQPIVVEDTPKPRIPEYIPTAREKATMKTIHNLPKSVQEEIYAFINQKVKESAKPKK